jgi:hypothetical protein
MAHSASIYSTRMPGTGPILIHKSTFQMLSAREHSRRAIHFVDNLTPVLVMDILGDLSKTLASGQDPAMKVAELAGKFHGSGGPVNHVAGLLVSQSLIGNDIPLTGQVLAQGGRAVDDPQLGRGFMIDSPDGNRRELRTTAGLPPARASTSLRNARPFKPSRYSSETIEDLRMVELGNPSRECGQTPQ